MVFDAPVIGSTWPCTPSACTSAGSVGSPACSKTSTIFATALRFEAEGKKIFVSYQQDGQTKRLDVTARFTEDDFDTSVGVSIVNGPGNKRIKAFIGVSF